MVNIGAWIFVAVLVIFIFMLNNLVCKRQKVRNGLALIDVQLKKRFDLIPNLAACVRGYMKFEAETLNSIAERRSRDWKSAFGALDSESAAAIGEVMLKVEDYPELKASKHMLHLQRTLNEVEAQIAAARRCYNMAVTEYNTAISIFPQSVVAAIFHFREMPLYSLPQSGRVK